MSISKPNMAIEDSLLIVPTEEEWGKMSEFEKRKKEDSIICALEQESSLMGETTIHFNVRASATEVLRRYYSGKGQKVFVAADLHTLYPGERAFYPDLLVVFDVEDHERSSWNVLREKKGLDFVLEIVSKSSRRRDLVEKLNLFARLGIPEYFIYDPYKYQLNGYQLLHEEEQDHYQAIKAKPNGQIFSTLLGLDIIVENNKLRFISADGLEILFGDELIRRLNEKLSTKDKAISDAMMQVEEEIKQKEEAEKEKEKAEKQKEKAEKQKEVEKLRADKLEDELRKLRLLLDGRRVDE